MAEAALYGGRRAGGTGVVGAVGTAAGLVCALLLFLPPGSAQAAPPDGGSGYSFDSFTSDPPATDYDHRTVVLSGRLERRDPAGAPAAAAGATVDLVADAVEGAPTAGGVPGGSDGAGGSAVGGSDALPVGGPGTGSGAARDAGSPSAPTAGSDEGASRLLGTVTTDADGRFRLPDVPIVPPPPAAGRIGAAEPLTLTVHALRRVNPDVYGGWDADAALEVTAVPSPARLTVRYLVGDPSPAGRRVTVQGTVERAADAGWLPVGGLPLRVGYQPDGDGAPLASTVDTDADGRFSVTFTAAAAGTASVVADPAADPYLDIADPDGSTQAVAAAAGSPAPSLTAGTPATVAAVAPVRRRTSAPARPGPSSPAATSGPVRTVPESGTLAATGPVGTPRIAFLTGGTTLIAAGLLLAVARRRMSRRA